MADLKALLYHISIVHVIILFINIMLIYFLLLKIQNGKEHKWLIEIKPYSQSVLPKATKKKDPVKLLGQTLIVKRNFDKWNAAVTFCKKRQWHFGVWTEKGINQMC